MEEIGKRNIRKAIEEKEIGYKNQKEFLEEKLQEFFEVIYKKENEFKNKEEFLQLERYASKIPDEFKIKNKLETKSEKGE